MNPEELLKELDDKVKDLWLAAREQSSIELLFIFAFEIIAKSSDDFDAFKQDILNDLIRKVDESSRNHECKKNKVTCFSKIYQDVCF